eukprot:TRINITY_DN121199_c0_g1_i1.p1 TRINITY_DN121199_c0_g1~~TRINITY_DN121199_c0_g1_i1.p1  ORF type:complete len:468 (+),score=54.33 TRINITY_DN121199_c0_g1_i1:131-1534(+)
MQPHMPGSSPVTRSTTVCAPLRLPSNEPRTLTAACGAFARYGEIARVDMHAGALSSPGYVLLSFSDVRGASRVVSEVAGAYLVPSPPQDFRSVVVPAVGFADVSEKYGGFQAFGELVNVSVGGLGDGTNTSEMIVEFYDCRAAQKLVMTVPGARPYAAAMSAPSMVPPKIVAPTQKRGMGNTCTPSISTPSLPPAKLPAGFRRVFSQEDLSDESPSRGATSSPSKPVREKVNSRDLARFDVVPEKILKGVDKRTTVMIRNIPKSCSKDCFVELLAKLSLSDRYSFFYMPFDKRRNFHCGFAFVNFKSPPDVLVLHKSMNTSLWHELDGGAGEAGAQNASMLPALSYARLQGQEELMKHFSVSAVMYDSDTQKRPVFCRGHPQATDPTEMNQDGDACLQSAECSAAGLSGKGNRSGDKSPASTTGSASTSPLQTIQTMGNDLGMRPQYVPLPKEVILMPSAAVSLLNE